MASGYPLKHAYYINNQSPITKLQLITNTQYSITKLEYPVDLRLGIRSLGINW